jgi:hypothetical protein
MYTRKRRKTKKIGGQPVSYSKDTDWHCNWNPLYVHQSDCGPNCFAALGYSNLETSIEMARRTESGIFYSTVIELLDEAYGRGHEWQEINKWNDENKGAENKEKNEYDDINRYLSNEEATIAYIAGPEFSHYFVLLKESYGFFAIDAQSCETWPLSDYIEDREKSGFEKDKLYLVSARAPSIEQNQVTMEMVKRFFPIEGETPNKTPNKKLSLRNRLNSFKKRKT